MPRYNREELAQTLFEESGDALFLLDPETDQLLDVNPTAQRLSGFSQRELISMPAPYLFRSENRGGLQRLRQAFVHSGPFHSQEGFLLRNKEDGHWTPVNLTVTRLHVKPKTLCLITARDVREQRESHAHLKKMEAGLRRLLASLSDYVWSVEIDGAGGIANGYTSPVVEKITGRPPEFYVGALERWLEPIHPEDRPRLAKFFHGLTQGRTGTTEHEYRVVWPDGTVRWVRNSIQANRTTDSANLRAYGVVTDITERKRAEDELRKGEERYRAFVEQSADDRVKAVEALLESEARFRSLVQNSSDLITIVEADGTIRYMSPSFTRILGDPVESCIGRKFIEYLHPDDRAAIWSIFAHRARTPGLGLPRECRLRHADGSWVYFEGIGNNLFDDPHIRGVVLHARDISERKRTAEVLTRQHALLRGLIDSIPDLIYYKDCRGVYLGCNVAFEKYAGRPERELVGLGDPDLFPADVAAAAQLKDRRVLDGAGAERSEEWIDYADGRRVQLEVLKTPFFDPEGRTLGLIGIGRDITERRRLEEQVRQAGKMEAIGQLAGGIAHDFNNLLTVILGNISLLRMTFPMDDPDGELLAATEKATTRAAELTSKLLGFSRRTTLRLEPADLSTYVEETMALLGRTIDPRIAVETKPAADLWKVHADPSQMHQVILNLCLNARDAMAGGGRLLLETANVVLDEEYERLHLEARAGEFVRLRVEDTGHGMSPEIRQRIFEPFFTTKGSGKGTGLGLAMVFGIVKQHHGWIDCYSEVNRGTRFDIYLPRHRLPEEQAGQSALAHTPCSGDETILLADDEPLIRNLGRTILERYGYRVLLAEDGQQAVDMYQAEQAAFDLVILDLTMPRLSGHDAFRQLVRLDPDVRVLFASGYSAEHVSDTESERLLGFIGKPYQPEELARSVRAALDRAAVRESLRV